MLEVECINHAVLGLDMSRLRSVFPTDQYVITFFYFNCNQITNPDHCMWCARVCVAILNVWLPYARSVLVVLCAFWGRCLNAVCFCMVLDRTYANYVSIVTVVCWGYGHSGCSFHYVWSYWHGHGHMALNSLLCAHVPLRNCSLMDIRVSCFLGICICEVLICNVMHLLVRVLIVTVSVCMLCTLLLL